MVTIQTGKAAFRLWTLWLWRLAALGVLFLLAASFPLFAQQQPEQKPQEEAEEEEPPPPIRPAHIVLINGKVWTLEPPPPPEPELDEEGNPLPAPKPKRKKKSDDGKEEEEMWVAEAVAIRGSRIMQVGTTEEIETLIGEGYTRVINLKGRLVLPGFIDNHTHFAQAGRLLLGLNLLEVSTPGEFRRRVREASRRLPQGAWLVGGDWGAYEQWAQGTVSKTPAPQPVPEETPPAPPGKPVPSVEEEGEQDKGAAAPDDEVGDMAAEKTEGEPAGSELEVKVETETIKPAAPAVPREDEWPPLQGFLPTKAMLDGVTGERPALISRFDREIYLANSAALRAAGINAATPDPEGGLIVRDAQGQPTGLLRGAAAELVQEVIPPPSFEQRKAEALRALDEARRYGVTSIHDNLADLETLLLYQDLHKSGELTLRVWARFRLDAWEPLSEYIRLYSIPHSYDGWGDQFIRLGGLKGWVDGIMGNSSALFFEPYKHQPENRGQLRDIMFPEGNLYDLTQGADLAGFSVTVHAIGDRANRILLDTYEKVFAENPERDRRFRVVHAQVVHPEDIKRFGELGLIAEVQPYHAIDDMRWMEERIGERARNAYAFKSLQDAGAVMSFGTDWPGTNAAYYPINPLLGIYAAVTRKTLTGQPAGGWFPEQRISLEDAVRFYTINNAYATFEESLKGSIKEGKIADMIVLDRDIFTRPPEELLETKVDYTILGGKFIYDPVTEAREARKKAAEKAKEPQAQEPNAQEQR